MTKKILFYGRDGVAAKKQHASMSEEKSADSVQLIQAESWEGERLEADEIEFTDDVPSGERERIRSMWGKFDNRQHGATPNPGGAHTPGSDRRNLNPKTRVDDPAKVEARELDHPGVVEQPGVRPEPGNVNPKPVGLDQTTGLPTRDESGRRVGSPD